MSSQTEEKAPKSASSLKTDDSDWSDINTEDEQEIDDTRLKIDLGDSPALSDDPKCLQRITPSTSIVKSKRVVFSNTISSERKKKPHIIGSGRKKKSARTLKPCTEIPNEILSSAEVLKFDSRLESSAKQLRLNRRQVKSVLNYLGKDPDFFNRILEMAGEKQKSESSAKIEPRVTRKQARALMETGGKVNWFLEKVSKTPKKVDNDDIAMLVQQDLPEDESDQEYDPMKDPEALAELSDDDSCATATPTSSIATTDVTCTPASDGRTFEYGKQRASTSGATPSDTFKRPLEASKVVRSLNFEHTENSQPSMSPRLTRSRANLKQVTIEELDMKYVPIDITPDMYDTQIDDYTLFLAETFGNPVENVDDNEAENDPDPDFVYQESEELKDFPDEFVNNRSTKISQKEVDELMQELFDAYELELEESHRNARKQNRRHSPSEFGSNQPVGFDLNQTSDREEIQFQGLTQEQTLLLAQQMRQHIQLLLQIGLLSSGSDNFSDAHFQAREMFSELVSSSFMKPYSMFAQDNLFPSIHTLDEWQKLNLPSGEIKKTTSKVVKYDVSKELKDFVGDKTAFIYPSLLPTLAFTEKDTKSMTWSKNEDNLIAIGLERFALEERPEKTQFFSKASKYLVEKGIIVNKKIAQVKCRLKNKRSSARKGDAIDHFLVHKIAPRVALQELEPYHSSFVVAPKFSHINKLPDVWRDHFYKIGDAQSAKIKTTATSVIQFSPSKMTFTITNANSSSMPILSLQSPAKKVSKYRKIAAKVGTPPSSKPKLSSSVLKKSRDTPLKKTCRQRKKDSPRISRKSQDIPVVVNTESQAETEHVVILPEDVMEVEQTEVETVEPSNNLLNEAMEECGIADEAIRNSTFSPPEEAKMEDHIISTSVIEHNQSDIDLGHEFHVADLTKGSQLPSEAAMRREQEALEIVMAAKEMLPQEKVESFFHQVTQFKNDPIKAFSALHSLCLGYPDLQEMLLDLLPPEAAPRLGPELHFQYSLRNRVKDFFRKLKAFYANQPSTLNSILMEISTSLSQPQLTRPQLKKLASKIFKVHQKFQEEFLDLIPTIQSLEKNVPEDDPDTASDEMMKEVETADVTDTTEEQNYGGDSCPCPCHSDLDSPHCFHCRLKFVDGKVCSREKGGVLKFLQ